MQADMQKVKPEHLKRDAYLYVRQSTPRQALENSESTKRRYALRQRAIATVTQQSVVAEVDRLLDDHSYEAVANILNSRGSVSGYGKPFTGRMIGRLRIEYGLKSRFERLRAKGMLTLEEMARRLGICTDRVKAWRAAGLLCAHLCNDKNEYLYEAPGANPPRKASGMRLSKRLQLIENVSQRPSEVQCEA
jgi:hypothetical protein